MYKFLIRKPNLPKDTYTLHKEVIDEDTKETMIYETEDLDELAEKYVELLETYNRSQIIPIEELGIEFFVDITDETDEGV